MTKTTNYQLNQWAKSDRVMMDDFNADNAKIDAALKANADAIRLLNEAGAVVTVYDPVAMDECRRAVGDRVRYAADMYEAAKDADALLLVTEWKEFRLPSWAVIKKAMRIPVLLDGRNIYEKKEIEELGFTYHCIGK